MCIFIGLTILVLSFAGLKIPTQISVFLVDGTTRLATLGFLFVSNSVCYRKFNCIYTTDKCIVIDKFVTTGKLEN